MIHFDSKQSQSIFIQNYHKNAMANNCKQCSIRIISHTTTPLPKAYDCVAVYIAGRRTSLVVYGGWPQPPTKNTPYNTQCQFREKLHANECDLLRRCCELFGWNSLCKYHKQIQCILASCGAGLLKWAIMGYLMGYSELRGLITINKLVLWPHVMWICVGSLEGLLSIRVLQRCQNNMTSPCLSG